MGTCGSKCCFTSPPTTPCISEPGSPDDKAVIFSDIPLPLPLATAPIPSDDPFPDSPKMGPFKCQVHPSPPVVSSSSSSSSVSTSTSTGTSTSTTTASYSSSSSYSTDNSFDSQPNHSGLARPPLRRKSFSNEFLLSCVENSNIVILDPARSGTKQKPVQDPISLFSGIPVTTSMQHLTASSLRQRTTTMRNNEPSNAKRARSVSPASRSGRKVIRPDPGSWSQVNSNITRPRTGDLLPPQWRPVNYNSQRASSNASSDPISRPVSADKRDFKVPTTAIEAKEREMRDGEAISRERARTPPLVEDLNNPLIAMDCFIFL